MSFNQDCTSTDDVYEYLVRSGAPRVEVAQALAKPEHQAEIEKGIAWRSHTSYIGDQIAAIEEWELQEEDDE